MGNATAPVSPQGIGSVGDILAKRQQMVQQQQMRDKLRMMGSTGNPVGGYIGSPKISDQVSAPPQSQFATSFNQSQQPMPQSKFTPTRTPLQQAMPPPGYNTTLRQPQQPMPPESYMTTGVYNPSPEERAQWEERARNYTGPAPADNFGNPLPQYQPGREGYNPNFEQYREGGSHYVPPQQAMSQQGYGQQSAPFMPPPVDDATNMVGIEPWLQNPRGGGGQGFMPGQQFGQYLQQMRQAMPGRQFGQQLQQQGGAHPYSRFFGGQGGRWFNRMGGQRPQPIGNQSGRLPFGDFGGYGQRQPTQPGLIDQLKQSQPGNVYDGGIAYITPQELFRPSPPQQPPNTGDPELDARILASWSDPTQLSLDYNGNPTYLGQAPQPNQPSAQPNYANPYVTNR